MKKITAFCLALSLLILPGNLFGAIIGNTDEEVKTIADPVMDQILQAITDDDYIKYSENFDISLKSQIPSSKFIEKRRQIMDEFGAYLFREYIGYINKKDSTWVLWKGTFDKSQHDILINLVLRNVNGKVLVEALYYQ